MDYLKTIQKIIASKSKVKILYFLVNNPGIYSANYICKYAEISPRSSLLSLKDLVDISVVNYKEGKGYELNHENYFVKEMINNIFSTNQKYIFNKFKLSVIKFFEPYLDKIYSILINKNYEILIILNLNITDEEFMELAQNESKALKKTIFKKISYTPKIIFFKKNFIPHDVYDNWHKIKPIYGESLKNISIEYKVSPEEIKKALKFFQIETF